MDELDPKLTEVEAYRIGESLYGLSLHELDGRIAAYRAEIARLEGERDKKSRERNAADALFSSKPT